MMSIADLTSSMSKCTRLKVGAVFERDGRPLCTGWNGLLEGVDDDCCEHEVTCTCYEGITDTMRPCKVCNGTGKVLKTKDTVIHAEMNALRYMAKAGISTVGATLYITHAPCVNCAKHIAGLGLKEIIYKNDYRDFDGINHLKSVNVKITKLDNKE